MTSYIKTTVLLLFLLCVTKLIQAEHAKSSNNTEAVEPKGNISESLTSKSLGEKPEEADKTTENPAKEKEEKKRSGLHDEIKKTEEKKTVQALRRQRRSYTEADSYDNYTEVGSESDHTVSKVPLKPSPSTDPPSTDPTSLQSDVVKKNDDKKRFLGLIGRLIGKAFSWLIDRSEDPTQANTNQASDFFSRLMNLIDIYADSLGIPPHVQEQIRELLLRYIGISSETSTVLPESNDTTSRTDVSKRTDDKKRFLGTVWKWIKKAFSWLFSRREDTSNINTKRVADFFAKLMNLFDKYGNALGIPADLLKEINELIKRYNNPSSKTSTTSRTPTTYTTPMEPLESNDKKALRTEVSTKNDEKKRFLGTIWKWIKKAFSWLFGRGEGGSNDGTKRAADFFNKLMNLFDAYASALNIPPHLQEEIKKLLKKFESDQSSEDSTTTSVPEPEAKAKVKEVNIRLRSEGESNTVEGNPLDSSDTGSVKSSEGEGPSLERVLQRYCELSVGSSNLITTLKILVKEFDVDGKSNTDRRQNTDFKKFIEALWLIYKNSEGTKKSGYDVHFIKEVINKYCEGLKRSNPATTTTFQRTQARESVRPRVRTKPSIMHLISEEEQMKRSEYDDVIGWRQGVFEPDIDQKVFKKQTEKSSPRIIKKSKIRKLKKPKNLKNRLLNLYNGKENGTGTRGHAGEFSKPKIIGHNENSTLFEVKTGVERDMGSKDSNPRLRCNVRTKGSMSDADGRTGRSKGHTFSEVPSNDTKALLCSSETSEVHRPSKNVYIKQSVFGKSVVSYDSPDKYIGHNYSPSKENLEIGTSGFSTLNDTSSKNQSISVVSTDSQNADSVSRSETKFVHGKGNQKGMESSANVEGSIDAVPNKNPFIMNSRQHSLGMIVENPDKNMESPLPVEKNEKLQTYSKFERTEDFDINFRSIDSVRPDFHHRRRPR